MNDGTPGVFLVVDDEPDIRAIVAQVARAASDGVPVLTAQDSDAAEAAFQGRPILAVLTDVRMPGRSGIELIDWVRRTFPDTPCAIMTGFLEDMVDDASMADLGVVAVLRKPFGYEECKQVVERLLDGRADPHPARR